MSSSTKKKKLCLVYVGAAYDIVRPFEAIPQMNHLICIDSEPMKDSCAGSVRNKIDIGKRLDHLSTLMEGKCTYSSTSPKLKFKAFSTHNEQSTNWETAERMVKAKKPTRLTWVNEHYIAKLRSRDSYQIDYFCNQVFPECYHYTLGLKELLEHADGIIIGGYFPHHSIWNMLKQNPQPMVVWLQDTYVPRTLADQTDDASSVVYHLLDRTYTPSLLMGIHQVFTQTLVDTIPELDVPLHSRVSKQDQKSPKTKKRKR